MKLSIIILLFLASCSAKTKNEIVNSSKIDNKKNISNLTLIYNSDNDSIYEINKNQSLEDILKNGVTKYNLVSGDSLTIILETEPEIIHAKTMNVIDMVSFIANSNDTIYINKFNDKTDIFKLVKGIKKNVIWKDSLLLKENYSYKKLSDLYNKFYESKIVFGMEFLVPNQKFKNQWDDLSNEYTSLNLKYYKLISDSIEKVAPGEKLLVDLLKVHQYNNLFNVYRLVNNPTLDKLLLDEFINDSTFLNKNRSSIIASYFTSIYLRKENVSLKDSYLNGFLEYPQKIRQYFKYRAIIGMNDKKYSRETIIHFVNEYKKEFNSTVALSSLLSEIEYGVKGDSDLILQDLDGHDIKWKDLLTRYKGKVVYVDFWASWCAPCIRAMPYSRELKEKLNEKDVAFIYLAYDDKEGAWKAMSEKLQLEENNFFILNSRSSEFVKNIQLETIPRYIIYGKDGKLIHQDAPGPDKKEVYEVIDNFLKNSNP